jgi:hypothetical protein
MNQASVRYLVMLLALRDVTTGMTWLVVNDTEIHRLDNPSYRFRTRDHTYAQPCHMRIAWKVHGYERERETRNVDIWLVEICMKIIPSSVR